MTINSLIVLIVIVIFVSEQLEMIPTITIKLPINVVIFGLSLDYHYVIIYCIIITYDCLLYYHDI